MTMRDLIEKLKERPKTVEEHRDEQKQDWERALAELVARVEEWLAPAVAAGVLTIAKSEKSIFEQDFGEYTAPVLHIEDGRLSVRIEPIEGRVVSVVAAGGKRYLGLRGRVDLICGPIRIPLVRDASGAWKALPLRGEPRELTEESFAEILSEVLLDE